MSEKNRGRVWATYMQRATRRLSAVGVRKERKRKSQRLAKNRSELRVRDGLLQGWWCLAMHPVDTASFSRQHELETNHLNHPYVHRYIYWGYSRTRPCGLPAYTQRSLKHCSFEVFERCSQVTDSLTHDARKENTAALQNKPSISRPVERHILPCGFGDSM
ncbi:hypothetical protein BC835DRAFT_494212 [Cytidiella melzeri]|nr:hypothetical protein BC835DRAFT_494212 [Cytidiella melzeri]